MNRFDYVKYDAIAIEKQEKLKYVFMTLEEAGSKILPDGRAKSLYFTALEEAYMWAGKAIRDEQIQRGSQIEHIPERG